MDEIRFDEKGLIPAIIQDHENDEVLMLGYMNENTLKRTLESGRVHFWSRSREKMWVKGETSGHTQEVKDVLVDCDMDTILVKVEQRVAACHTGYRSCFYRVLNGEDLKIDGEKIFDPKDRYGESK